MGSQTLTLGQDFMITIAGLPVSINHYRLGLEGLRQEEGALFQIPALRQKIENILKKIDQKMTALLLPSEETHLTSWANWMGACTKKMYSLDRNIPFINKPQWSWDEVIESLAFLEAFRTDVQILLMKHGVDLDA